MQYSIEMEYRIMHIVIVFLLTFLSWPERLAAAQRLMQTPEVEIVYDEGSLPLANEVAAIYPIVREGLGKYIAWGADFRPRIALIGDRRLFVHASGGDIFVAYAVPRRYHIVLDVSRVYVKPFTLEATLKHELCHLLLNHHIRPESLPRWLDEGVCQWVSGGVSELLAAKGKSALERAVVTDNLMRMSDIEIFPEDGKSLLLAYEQSRSFVEYIVAQYGRDSLLRILDSARNGYTSEEAIEKNLSISFAELESGWRSHLKRRISWFTHLSNNLDTILFFLAGMVTVYGFIRFLKKKREYVDGEEGDE